MAAGSAGGLPGQADSDAACRRVASVGAVVLRCQGCWRSEASCLLLRALIVDGELNT